MRFMCSNCTFKDPDIQIGFFTVCQYADFGEGVVVGHHCTIGESSYAYKNFQHKEDVGRVLIGDNVEFKSGVTIHRGNTGNTVVGDNTKIDVNSFVAHDVKIGKNCLLTSMVGIGGYAEIGDNCRIHGGVRIGNRVKICSGVEIGTLSLVLKDITEPGLYYGIPARKIK